MDDSFFDRTYEYVEAPSTLCSNLVILKRERSVLNARCLLIDRDGTLIEHFPYLIDFRSVSFIPEVIELILFANQNSVPVFVVSNQAGVAHGYFGELDTILLNSQILGSLFQEYGAYIDGVFCCVSHPDPKGLRLGSKCKCRKPEPGLLSAAIRECGVIPTMAGMLGDADSDVSAGLNAGLKYTWRMSEENRVQVCSDIQSWMSGEPVQLCT